MTCIEKLRELHPDWDDEEVEYYINRWCPSKDYILHKPLSCAAHGWEDSDDNDCDKCWNREVYENEKHNRHNANLFLTGEDMRLLEKLAKYLGCTFEEVVSKGLRLLEMKAGLYVWEGLVELEDNLKRVEVLFDEQD